MKNLTKLSAHRDHHACYGKFFCHVSPRSLIGAAILLAGWALALASLLDVTANAPGVPSQYAQQMIWNPSPK